jgi:hypothetical protein
MAEELVGGGRRSGGREDQEAGRPSVFVREARRGDLGFGDLDAGFERPVACPADFAADLARPVDFAADLARAGDFAVDFAVDLARRFAEPRFCSAL